MKKSDFYYELPPELIAQDPLDKRSDSRLLVMDKVTGEINHKKFVDILDYLHEGDTLVLNESKVIPARFIGNIEGSMKPCEIFMIRRKEKHIWECLVRPGKKLKVGARVIFGDGELKAEILDIVEDGNRIVRFEYDGVFEEKIAKIGEVPLPPYITHSLKDKNRYQTVYAKNEGSVAAPTAGLHFTDELLDTIKSRGINVAKLTLHVSLGTFRPVKEEEIENHHMHTEEVFISDECARLINDTKEKGHRVICVGTTSCRSIESAAKYNEKTKRYELSEYHDETSIFIYPGYKFKMMDALITNFHLPESTLIMLVSAFAGREHVLNAYKEAIKERYRFFSFGDACFFV
ncbi:MAG: tRNA preQ1(34) S-adenosylmethionine ribosyltransferase-isomerase QueA [Lachnospiraceae bacterium]|nr:tRNA preQ1(34) S-adenosylmethionine ribosyltransferase-isomerase QueA [Lachnospiraceae bacterium]